MANLTGCDYCGKEIESNKEFISTPVYRMVPVDNTSNYPPGSMAATGAFASTYQPQQIGQRDYHAECWAQLDDFIKNQPTPTVTPQVPDEAPSAGVEEPVTEETPPADTPPEQA